MLAPDLGNVVRRPRIRWKHIALFVLLPIALALGLAWSLCAAMPGRSFRGPAPATTTDERALAAELRTTVEELCAHGPRNLAHPDPLARAVELVEARFASTGRAVERETFTTEGPAPDSTNVVLELPGTSLAREIVLVGAHLDSADDAPGANDDASGVAALCALARRLAAQPRERTLRFVAFANEEPPYFWTDAMGSRVHARRASERGESIVAMLALETLGCYSDSEGSQRYPIQFLALAYPSRGNFVAFVGNLGSRALVRECIGTFRAAASFPSEGAALPEPIPGVGWSDHASFWPYDVPAVMVTDTAVFRDPHYHERSDTPENLDFERLARVVLGLEPVLTRLATR